MEVFSPSSSSMCSDFKGGVLCLDAGCSAPWLNCSHLGASGLCHARWRHLSPFARVRAFVCEVPGVVRLLQRRRVRRGATSACRSTSSTATTAWCTSKPTWPLTRATPPPWYGRGSRPTRRPTRRAACTHAAAREEGGDSSRRALAAAGGGVRLRGRARGRNGREPRAARRRHLLRLQHCDDGGDGRELCCRAPRHARRRLRRGRGERQLHGHPAGHSTRSTPASAASRVHFDICDPNATAAARGFDTAHAWLPISVLGYPHHRWDASREGATGFVRGACHPRRLEYPEADAALPILAIAPLPTLSSSAPSPPPDAAERGYRRRRRRAPGQPVLDGAAHAVPRAAAAASAGRAVGRAAHRDGVAVSDSLCDRLPRPPRLEHGGSVPVPWERWERAAARLQPIRRLQIPRAADDTDGGDPRAAVGVRHRP